MAGNDMSQQNFHKICVIGGGITGAIMVLLLKKSQLFKLSDIGWIKQSLKLKNDFRTTFYNKTSLELLKSLNILNKLKKNDFTPVKSIQVFGPNYSLPLEQNYVDTKREFGAVIKNDIVLNIIEEELKDIKQYESFVNNTKCNHFERTLYLENKKSINTHLVLSADGKNSYLRKLLSINTINKKTNHIAISGFLKQSKDHKWLVTTCRNKIFIKFVLLVEE